MNNDIMVMEGEKLVDAAAMETCSNGSSAGEGPHTTSTASRSSSSTFVAKADLWQNATTLVLPEASASIQWYEDPAKNHRELFARVVSSSSGNVVDTTNNNALTIGKVVEAMVDETWKRTAKEILETKKKVKPDAFPPADQLLQLGAVWLLHEPLYCEGQRGARAHRLTLNDLTRVVDWNEYTLRIHIAPERHFAADTVDWSKFCKGLLLPGGEVEVSIAGTKPHVPIVSEGALPDGEKDGAIVYEDDDLGFAVLNKPGDVPIHPSLSNHTDDVVSKYSKALNKKKKQLHVSLPTHYPEIDTEAYGLLAVATKSQFSAYMTQLLKAAEEPTADGEQPQGLSKVYKCLVCVKDPDRMGLMEAFQKTGNLITHYYDPVQHRFNRNPPQQQQQQQTNPGRRFSRSSSGSSFDSQKHGHKCQLRVRQVGDEAFRAACVSTEYQNAADSSLARQLWGPEVPADVHYVMELQVETVGHCRAHQVRGQLAALGFPIVGDFQRGGGKVSVFRERHEWTRMALQCCKVSFPLPVQEKKGDPLVASEEDQCVFRLNKAWWSEYLHQYELFHVRSG